MQVLAQDIRKPYRDLKTKWEWERGRSDDNNHDPVGHSAVIAQSNVELLQKQHLDGLFGQSSFHWKSDLHCSLGYVVIVLSLANWQLWRSTRPHRTAGQLQSYHQQQMTVRCELAASSFSTASRISAGAFVMSGYFFLTATRRSLAAAGAPGAAVVEGLLWALEVWVTFEKTVSVVGQGGIDCICWKGEGVRGSWRPPWGSCFFPLPFPFPICLGLFALLVFLSNLIVGFPILPTVARPSPLSIGRTAESCVSCLWSNAVCKSGSGYVSSCSIWGKDSAKGTNLLSCTVRHGVMNQAQMPCVSRMMSCQSCPIVHPDLSWPVVWPCLTSDGYGHQWLLTLQAAKKAGQKEWSQTAKRN